MRLVLDTNVWLDWLVFDGNEVADLREARHSDAVRFIIDTPCLDELSRVLAYPEFRLDDAAIALRLEQVRGLADAFPAASGDPPSLPRCKDPDDQKFLRLAAAAKAGCLVTRDNDLLRLGGRTARTFGFTIRRPAQWRQPARSSVEALH